MADTAHKAATQDERSTVPRLTLRRKLVYSLGVLTGLLVIADVAVRLLSLGPPVYAPVRIEPPRLPMVYVEPGMNMYLPNSTFTYHYDPRGDARGYFDAEGRITYHINNVGMRGPDVSREKPEGTYRVICLGDSLTFGEGVHWEDTYPARLEELLGPLMPGRMVEVLNAGTQGHQTRHSGAVFVRRDIHFEPDLVILGFFLNDATDDRTTIRQHVDRTQNDNVSSMARISRIWEIVERSWHGKRMQAEYFQTTRESFSSPEWEACREIIRRINEWCRKQGVRFIVAIFPMLYELDGDYPFEDIHTLLHDELRGIGVLYLDLLDVYRGRPAESLWVHPTDPHPNDIAHQVAAEAIADFLQQIP